MTHPIRRCERVYEISVPDVGMIIAYPSLYTIIIRYCGCQTHGRVSWWPRPSPTHSEIWDCSTNRLKLMGRTAERFVQA